MTGREQFEAWFLTAYVQQEYWNKGFSALEKRNIKYLSWRAWQASRNVEIKLPEKCGHLNTVNGYVLPEAERYDEAIDDCAEAIRAAGFKVKGG